MIVESRFLVVVSLLCKYHNYSLVNLKKGSKSPYDILYSVFLHYYRVRISNVYVQTAEQIVSIIESCAVRNHHPFWQR